jgi:hypothetical protein
LIALWVMAIKRRWRIGRSWRLYRLGLGLGAYYRGEPRGVLVTDRLYRKALRGLDAGSYNVDSSGTGLLAGVRLREVLEARLGEHSAWTWLRRSWRRVLRVGVPVAVALATLIGAIPSLRWAVFPPDRARGKPWVASSAWAGFPKTGVMSGPVGAEGRFHTLEEKSPSVAVDLESVFAISKVEVENRLDCCLDRPLPLALELSTDSIQWKRVAYRRAEFRRWTATFPPTPARFVRARIDRTSILHLLSIRAY